MTSESLIKTSSEMPIPSTMKAWVLGDPDQLTLTDKPVPMPARAEILVRIDAVAICATDLEIIHYGTPALIEGGPPFNKNFTPGHEYMGTVAALGPGVDEFEIGDRVTVEIHSGCGQCKRCRQGMYTSCLNYGLNYGDVNKGHRANGFTTDGGFAEYAVNNINTVIRVPDAMSDEVATLVVTLDLVARSDWTTIAPGCLVIADMESRQRFLHPITRPAMAVDYVLIEPASTPLSPAAQLLCEELQAELSRVCRRCRKELGTGGA